MPKVNLSTPWVEYYTQMTKLFGDDPDIKIIYDEENYVIDFHVKGDVKAKAIREIVPETKAFGNVIVTNNVITEEVKFDSTKAILEAAFKGNPALSYIQEMEGDFSFNATYVVFKNKVVQYFDDNLSDINGNKSTLYENIAKEVLDIKPGMFFCTDIEK